MQKEISSAEHLSALWDGELDEVDAIHLLALKSQPLNKDAWKSCAVIHDVLQGTTSLQQCHRIDISKNVIDFLLHESAEQDKIMHPIPATTVVSTEPLAKNAANDAFFRWKTWSGFLGVAILAFAVWLLMSNHAITLSSGMLAAGQGAAVVSEDLAVARIGDGRSVMADGMLRDARLDEVMSAGKKVSGAGNLQPPADYLRNASFEKSN